MVELAEWAIASEMPRAAGSLTSRAAPEPVSTVTDGRGGKPAGMTVPCSRKLVLGIPTGTCA